MDDASPTTKPKAKASTPFVVFDVAKAAADDAESSAGGKAAAHGRWLRWSCCCLAVAGALGAVTVLALSLTVLKVRDPTLSMESVAVKWFSVGFDSADAASASPGQPLRINVTLVGTIVIRNPNYESMRFGASVTEIFVDGAGVAGAGIDQPVGVGRAPPGEVPARGASRVAADVDVLVDRALAPAVVAQVLFGGGEVRLATRTAVDGRISLLGGLYGRRTVRVAMRCRLALRVSSAKVVAAGNPACVADFGR